MKQLGKKYSLLSKIIATAFVVLAWLLNGYKEWNYSAWEIIQVGAFIMATGLPIDGSKWMTILKDKKKVSVDSGGTDELTS